MNKMISKYKVGAAMLGMTLSLGLTSCDDLFEPAIENHLGFDYAYEHPDYADNVLGNAYTRLPNTLLQQYLLIRISGTYPKGCLPV